MSFMEPGEMFALIRENPGIKSCELFERMLPQEDSEFPARWHEYVDEWVRLEAEGLIEEVIGVGEWRGCEGRFVHLHPVAYADD